VSPGHAGNWPRAFPTADGWDFFYATGGEYWYAPLDDALVPVTSDARPLTGHTNLVDHAIARCPDGTWLHGASYTVGLPDDSAVAFLYDADLNLVEEQSLVVRGNGENGTATRDLPVVCGDSLHGVGIFAGGNGNQFVRIAAGTEPVWTRLDPLPFNSGSGWVELGGELWIVGPPSGLVSGALRFAGYDAALTSMGVTDVPVVDEPLTAYWSQAFIEVGDYRVVAFMVADPAAGWQMQDGNVYLAAFDAAWNLVDLLAVTNATPPVGNMQPGLARKGDRLLVTYSRDLTNYGVYVSIDAAFAGVDADGHDTDVPVDTAADTDRPTDTSEPHETAVDSATPDAGDPATEARRDPKTCGCEVGGGRGALWLPLLWGLRRRRNGPRGG
jgi:hypothetical protein